MQMGIVFKNQTGIESWIHQKAEMRQEETGGKAWVYPYDLGRWENFRLVFCYPPGNGIVWPVVSGCDQYTLTVSVRGTRHMLSYDLICGSRSPVRV